MEPWRLILFLPFCIGLFAQTSADAVNACCSLPCQNNGICISKGDSYECDCTGLNFYGKQCETPTWYHRITRIFKPRFDTLHMILTSRFFTPLWMIVNNVPFLQQIVMKYIYLTRGEIIDSPALYTSDHSYITLDSYYNRSYYSRTLPPRDKTCPKRSYPDVDLLIDKFFRRREFKPEPHGSNMLFAYYAQHFTHQFFKTDHKKGPGFTAGNEGVDVSHIYGDVKATTMALRSMKDGKLKSQFIDGEEFPPFLNDTVGVKMAYPAHIPENRRFALGHPFYAMLPGLFMYAVIWHREHNRVCDVLRKIHPEWDDEQLFQTARLIIVGETIKITIEDYVQHLSQYHFKLTFAPELTHTADFEYANRIHVEFNHLYRWHPFMPDEIPVDESRYTIKDFMANPIDVVMSHGIDNFINASALTRAGALTFRNHAQALLGVLKAVIVSGRKLDLLPVNAYRVRFDMPKYKTFMDMTKDKALADELEEVYGDVDNVEFYPGLLFESPSTSVTPITMVNIGGPYSVKGLISNPICSVGWWKPATFGGEEGMRLVREASLKKLFCLNMKSKCKDMHMSFSVPGFPTYFDQHKEFSEKDEL